MSTLKSVENQPDLFYDPSNGIIHCRTFVNGRKITRSTKVRMFTDEGVDQGAIRKARAEARKIQKKLILGDPKQRGRKLFEDLWHEWVDQKKSQWSDRYYRDIEDVGRLYFLPAFGHKLPGEVTEEVFDRWVKRIREEKNNPKMRLKKHKAYLTLFLNYLHRLKLIPNAPKFDNPDRVPGHRKTYTKDEIQALLKNASMDLRLQIKIGYRMGMRKGEILNLRWNRIDWEESVIRLQAQDTKTKKPRIIPIPKDILKELESRVEASSPLWVFPSIKDKRKPQTTNETAWAACKRRAGVQGRFHELRHTCATQMAHSNISPGIACRILGMSLEVYDKVYCQPSETQIKKAYEKMNWGAW